MLDLQNMQTCEGLWTGLGFRCVCVCACVLSISGLCLQALPSEHAGNRDESPHKCVNAPSEILAAAAGLGS